MTLQDIHKEFDDRFNNFRECNPPHCHNMCWYGHQFIEIAPFYDKKIKKLINKRDKVIVDIIINLIINNHSTGNMIDGKELLELLGNADIFIENLKARNINLD